MSREELAAFLMVVPTQHRTLFRVLVSVGLRISEALSLCWKDLQLDGSAPCLKVRRAYVKGNLVPTKTRYGRRSVPLDRDLVGELRGVRATSRRRSEGDLVFPSAVGTHFDADNLRSRVVKPVAEEAGVPWATFHTFRHTCASLLFARGANAVQVQRWLGHHSPAFTLERYIHLLPDELGEPLSLKQELAPCFLGSNGIQPVIATSVAT